LTRIKIKIKVITMKHTNTNIQGHLQIIKIMKGQKSKIKMINMKETTIKTDPI